MDDLIQGSKLRVEAHIPSPGNKWSLPCVLHVYGLPEQRSAAIDVTRRMGVATSQITGVGGGSSTGSSVVNIQKFDRQKSQAELEKMFSDMCDDKALGELPPFQQPPVVITTLQPHQVRSLPESLLSSNLPPGSSPPSPASSAKAPP